MLDTMRRKFTPIFLAGIVLMLSLTMLLTDFAPNMGGGKAVGVVATVNGKNITFGEFQRTFQQRLQMFKGFTGKDLTEKEIQQYGIRRNTVNSLIQRALIIDGGKKLGIRVGPSELRDKIWSLLKDAPYFKDKEKVQFNALTYKQVIQGSPYGNVQNFERLMETDLLVQKTEELIKQNVLVTPDDIISAYRASEDKVDLRLAAVETGDIRKKMKVSSGEISKFFGDTKNIERARNWFVANQSDYDQKAQAKASHILIREDKEKPEDAKKQIEEIAKKLTVGNFLKLANKFTQDPSGKGKGGSLGWFGKGAMVPEFEKVAFNLKPGKISNPIKTSFGWHIIYVQDRKNEQKATFESVKSKIAKSLLLLDQGEKVRVEAKKLASRFAEVFDSGSGLQALEKRSGIKSQELPGLTADGAVPGNLKATEVLKEAFQVPSPLDTGAKVYETGGGFLTAKIVKRNRPNESVVSNLKSKKPMDWQRLESSLIKKKENRLFELWLDSQSKKAKITRNEDLYGT